MLDEKKWKPRYLPCRCFCGETIIIDTQMPRVELEEKLRKYKCEHDKK